MKHHWKRCLPRTEYSLNTCLQSQVPQKTSSAIIGAEGGCGCLTFLMGRESFLKEMMFRWCHKWVTSSGNSSGTHGKNPGIKGRACLIHLETNGWTCIQWPIIGLAQLIDCLPGMSKAMPSTIETRCVSIKLQKQMSVIPARDTWWQKSRI